VSLAKTLDVKASASWIGHPYFDVIDNSSDFENKICRMIAVNINDQSINDPRKYFYLYFIGGLSKIGFRYR